MPHKRNPIGSENVSGLSRVVRGEMVTAFENMNLWHERDISHSSAERVILPDATSLVDYVLNRMNRILNNLVINEDEIKKDLEMTHGLIFSQQVMLKLIDKGWTREEAYDTVQPIAMEVWNTGQHFMDLLLKDSKIKTTLSDEEVKSIFNYRYHLKNVDAIYQRCGINVE
ncbi:adenylosuccinate lyase [Pediococcus acidilactici NGRI 0510Q]|nr:adenylosuccinate lyase [Pediococcus acidilactici NGRI 0510Q]